MERENERAKRFCTDHKEAASYNNTHNEIRYPCDQCEYAATKRSNLKLHKKSLHKGVRYPCGECEYLATHASSLKRHKKCVHEGVKKLDISKYQISRDEYQIMEPEFIETYNISDLDTEIKMEEDFDDPLSLMGTEPQNIEAKYLELGLSASVKQEADTYELDSKLEITEDFVIKTESLD